MPWGSGAGWTGKERNIPDEKGILLKAIEIHGFPMKLYTIN